MKNNILLIGFGSIAQKHFKILRKKNLKIYCYVKNANFIIPKDLHIIKSLDSLSFIDYAIICTPTNCHINYANTLIKQKIPVLIEKPLSDHFDKPVQDLIDLSYKENTFVMVGFNLRFLPIIELVTKYLYENKLGKILYANLEVGQYLPNWRPQKNYSKTYSANFKQGGGAALDLIHEIDLGLHWFGYFSKPKIYSNKLGNLKMNCENLVQITSINEPVVNIHMDMLNHVFTRRYTIIGDKGSLVCDIGRKFFQYVNIKNKITEITDHYYFDRDISFTKELEFFIKAATKKKTDLINERFLGIDALKIAIKARKYV